MWEEKLQGSVTPKKALLPELTGQKQAALHVTVFVFKLLPEDFKFAS